MYMPMQTENLIYSFLIKLPCSERLEAVKRHSRSIGLPICPSRRCHMPEGRCSWHLIKHLSPILSISSPMSYRMSKLKPTIHSHEVISRPVEKWVRIAFAILTPETRSFPKQSKQSNPATNRQNSLRGPSNFSLTKSSGFSAMGSLPKRNMWKWSAWRQIGRASCRERV